MSISKHISEHIKLPGDFLLPEKTLPILLGYNNSRKVTIAGVAGAGTGYQVALEIDPSQNAIGGTTISIAAAKSPASNNSGSIRIIDKNGNPLPFWVDENVYFWVRISDNLDTDTYIYVYDNGDANAPNISDGAATFDLLFSHFTDTAVPDDMVVAGGTPTFAGVGASAYIQMTGANQSFSLKSINSIPDGHQIVFRGRVAAAVAAGNGFILGFDDTYSLYHKANTAVAYAAKGVLGTDEIAQATAVYTTANVSLSIARNGGVGFIRSANQFAVPYTINSTGVSTADAPVYINHVYGNALIARTDYIFVKKWTGVVEPAVSAVSAAVTPHDHATDATGSGLLRPTSIDCTGLINADADSAQGFGVRVDGVTNYDCHGLLVNAVGDDPSINNKICNIRFSLNGAARWTFKKAGNPNNETGGVTGSDLILSPHDNAGSPLESTVPFTWSRDGRYSVPSVPPATAGSAGRAGTITWDANYIYICTATNTWKRVAIATWV